MNRRAAGSFLHLRLRLRLRRRLRVLRVLRLLQLLQLRRLQALRLLRLLVVRRRRRLLVRLWEQQTECNAARCSTAQCTTVQQSTVQCSATQPDAVEDTHDKTTQRRAAPRALSFKRHCTTPASSQPLPISKQTAARQRINFLKCASFAGPFFLIPLKRGGTGLGGVESFLFRTVPKARSSIFCTRKNLHIAINRHAHRAEQSYLGVDMLRRRRPLLLQVS